MSEGTRKQEFQEIIDINQPSTSKAALNFVHKTNPIIVEEPNPKPQQNRPSKAVKSVVNHKAAVDLFNLLTAKDDELESAKFAETSLASSAVESCAVIQEENLIDTNHVPSFDKDSTTETLPEPDLVLHDKLEIAPSNNAEKKEESLEINIKPEEVSPEDDIFSGIFSAPDETESVVASPASAIGIMSCSDESSDTLEGAVESPAAEEVTTAEDNEEEQQVENEVLPTTSKTDFRSMSFTDEEMKQIEVTFCCG